MPRGRYRLHTPDGPVLEQFSCGPGPAGWRYAATRVDAVTGAALGRLDLVLDAGGRVVRHEVEAGGWLLRGGAVGPGLLWRRGGREEAEGAAAGFTGTSPGYAAAAVRRLRPREPVRARFVRVDDAALATLVVEQGWARTGATGVLGREVTRYEVADLSTGERSVVQLAGDVVVEAGDVVLEDLLG